VDTALTILICTHNRADLLERALASLNAAKRPGIEAIAGLMAHRRLSEYAGDPQ